MSTLIGHSHHTTTSGHLSLMSCVRESSPPQDLPPYDIEKTGGSKRKFWDVRKWFKRKNKVPEDATSSTSDGLEQKDPLRSRSTSELSIAEEQIRRRSGTPMHPGLSVSHDSVFHSPHSGSELELDAAQSSSSLSVHHPLQPDVRLQSELTKKLLQRRHRGDTSEDDEGLPRSPCNSPTTTDGILEKTVHKDNPTTKSHSTCSDGSLLSMGSSEMDEDSFGQHSRHSSKLSLHDKRTPDSDSDFELGSHYSSAPLNHSAAHHKMAVKPKRTHGAPRRNRGAQKVVSALPTTPEVNEDSSIRSLTPDNFVTGPLDMSASSKLSRSRSNAGGAASTKSQDIFATLIEDDEKEDKKSDSLFGWFMPRKSGRKKKDKEAVKVVSSTNTSETFSYSSVDYGASRPVTIDSNLAIRPNALLRTGPASRQRIIPIDIPASPELNSSRSPNASPEKSQLPFQVELRHKLGTSPSRQDLEIQEEYHTSSVKQHYNTTQLNTYMSQMSSMAYQENIRYTTPPIDYNTPPQSPPSPWRERKPHKSLIGTKFDDGEDGVIPSLAKVRIPGLSSLQQKVLSLNEDDLLDGGFKSLTDFAETRRSAKPVAKSHSFKSANQLYKENNSHQLNYGKELKSEDKEVIKAASLDSVQNLDNRLVETINEVKVEESLQSNGDSITISGPSHKAVVNIARDSNQLFDGVEQKSVTKIHLKTDNTHSMTTKSCTVDSSLELNQRRFSKENIEVIEKDPKRNVSVMNIVSQEKSQQKKSSVVNITLNTEDLSPDLSDEEKPVRSVKKSLETKSHIYETSSTEQIEFSTQERISSYTSVSENVILSSPKTKLDSTTPPLVDEKVISNEKPLLSPNKPKPTLLPKTAALELTMKKLQDVAIVVEKTTTTTTPDSPESVTLRRKSLVKSTNEDEPELMKVFARRSLKLKDSDCELISQQVNLMVQNNLNTADTKRDSDKENQEESPEERRKSKDCPRIIKETTVLVESSVDIVPLRKPSYFIEPPPAVLEERRKSLTTNNSKEIQIQSPPQQPKIPNKETAPQKIKEVITDGNIDLRKSIPNKFVSYQRTVSLNTPRVEAKIIKQTSLVDRPKTDSWIHTKNEKDSMELQQDIITCLTEPDVIAISKPQNFNQRKAEWEKRAQDALKKNIP